MLFLSEVSRRVQSGPSNAFHLQRKATSQGRGSGIDASQRQPEEQLCPGINKSACAKGPVHFVNRQIVIEPTASAKPVTL